MKTLKLFAISVLGVVALAACQREEAITDHGQITVKANIGSMTKVADNGNASSFTAGDKITVYGWIGSADQVPAEKVVDGVNNELGSDGKWTPASEMRWADETSDHYFLGVYPQRTITDFTADSFTLDPANYGVSDLLIATSLSGLKESETPVDLNFDHAMAKLNVNLRFRTQWDETPTVSSLTATAKSKATVNYLTKSVTATDNATPISLSAASSAPEGYALSYSSLMIPQEGVRTIIITIDGKDYIHEATTDIPLVSGKITVLDLVVGADKTEPQQQTVSISLGSITISNWIVDDSLPEGEAIEKPEAVDLGLSVKWASFNLGASNPEDFGDYYAWGETETKTNYSWSTYKWCNGSEYSLTKYNTSPSYGEVDKKTRLEAADDVAHVKLGGKWRMPTDAEWAELLNNCTEIWTAQNGINGYLFTATNGNSIFLPAAGSWDGTDLGYAGSYGNYWSSSLSTYGPEYVWLVAFNSSEVDRYDCCRYYGHSVRPVTE